MAARKPNRLAKDRREKLEQAIEILRELRFGSKQSNEVAAYTLLACAGLQPHQQWNDAQSPLRGITPIIDFIDQEYGVRYAPNTRETIRDEAVKYFVEAGLLIKNPDDLKRPTNSGKTVYQLEPHAVALLQAYGSLQWNAVLDRYLASRESIRSELHRNRELARIPVRLPSGDLLSLSPGGQNPLIKAVLEEFCPRWVPGGVIAYIGDAENKSVHLQVPYLARLGIAIDAPEKIPDVVVHDPQRNWLVLIEAVTTAGPVDGKRRKELKLLFSGSTAGLVFVTAFSNRETMRSFVTQISWESEVWIADDPDHLIHFNGERFLGPYDDVLPKSP